MFKLTTIALALFITSAINIVAAIISWQRRRTKGGLFFAVGMTGVTFWTLAAGFDYAAIPIPLKVLFAKFEYTGYNVAFASFALFVLTYMGYGGWMHKIWAKTLFVSVPVSNILLAWTNDWHGWLWSGFVRGNVGDNTVIFQHGPGYIWAAVTGYLMIFVIIAPLWQAARRGSELSRRQARLLFFASLVTILGSLLYLLEDPRFKGVDWTPISFSISSFLFLLALYNTRLLDLAPIARDKLVSSLSDGMIVLDMQNRIIDINQAAADMIQLPLEMLVGKALAEVAPPTQSFLEHPPDQELKTELEFGASDKHYFDLLVSPLQEGRNKLIGRLIIFRDITTRKKNELRLLQLTQTVEQSPASVMITDLDGNITYVNPRLTALTGYAPSEIIGKSPNIMQSGQTPDAVYRELWNAITSGHTWHGEFLNRKKNGDLYWEDTVIAPVMDPEGQIISYLAVKIDITQRKGAETSLRNANQQLANQLAEIELLQASLREQAIRDPLTKLYNRRFLNEAIVQEFHHAKRASEALSIILLDIDHFKAINDTYGHVVGDECLVAVGNLLQQHVRKSDIACRYGGEEFMLVLPATNLEGAARHAEKLRLLVSTEVLKIDTKEIRITISLGISTFPEQGTSYPEIINNADEALYISKHTGRNRVTVWSKARATRRKLPST